MFETEIRELENLNESDQKWLEHHKNILIVTVAILQGRSQNPGVSTEWLEDRRKLDEMMIEHYKSKLQEREGKLETLKAAQKMAGAAA